MIYMSSSKISVRDIRVIGCMHVKAATTNKSTYQPGSYGEFTDEHKAAHRAEFIT